jgi:hypothetical protein
MNPIECVMHVLLRSCEGEEYDDIERHGVFTGGAVA